MFAANRPSLGMTILMKQRGTVASQVMAEAMTYTAVPFQDNCEMD